MLTDMVIRGLKPKSKLYKRADGKGLSVTVHPKGTVTFYYRCRRPNGKQCDVRLGNYPVLSLKDARIKADKLRVDIYNGVDPITVNRRSTEPDNWTVEALAAEWIERQDWASSYSRTVSQRLHKWVIPTIGSLPIADLTPKILLDECLTKIEAHGTYDTAHRVKGYVSNILRYGVAKGRANRDITSDLRGALKRSKTQHYRALLTSGEVGAYLRAVDSYDGATLQVKHGLKLLPMLMLRPGELRQLRWEDIGTDRIEIPADRMKGGRPHIVPLSSQAQTILEDLRRLSGNDSVYVFPSPRSKSRCISNNAFTAALRTMNIDTTAHGFRATARTLLEEELEEPVRVIEMQLAHTVRDPLGRAYNRTQLLERRKLMLQRWSDYLDRCAVGAA